MNKNRIKSSTAQELIAVEDIKDEILYSATGYLFTYLWVKAKDAILFSDTEKEQYFNNLSLAVEGEKEPWQLISIPRVVDTHDLIDNLLTLRKKTEDTAKITLLNNEIMALQKMAKEGLKEPLIFIKLWQHKGKRAEENLLKRRSDFITKLKDRQVEATAMTTQDIVYICKLFAELGQHHNMNTNYDDYKEIPKLKGSNKKAEKTEEILRREKIDMITPTGGIRFKNRTVTIGSMTGKCLYASIYPSQLNYEWAVRIMNCTEAVTAMTFNLAQSGELATALSKSVAQNTNEALNQRDARTQKMLLRQAKDADALLDKMDGEQEPVGQFSIVTMPFCDDEDNIDEVSSRVSGLFAANRIKTRQLGMCQKEGFLTVSPYAIPHDVVLKISQRIMPLSTYIGGSPMTINTLKDDNGFYFAKTMDGGIISLDFKKRAGDRTNSNFVITGKPGTGKSTAIKHIALTMYMSGWKVVIIDPEREYKDMCDILGGTWLDTGGGTSKSNVLQVRSVPVDDEDEKDTLYNPNDLPLVNHMKTLETFIYSYLPNLTDLQKSLLNKALVELYNNFGITWDTDVSTFKPEQFPIFSDLYNLLLAKAKKDDRYEDIASLFYNIAEGSDSFLWNGYTNINVNSDFVVFDTNKLAGANERVVSTQYFNLLTQAWQIMSEDKEQPVMLLCDEAYLLIDPNVPQTVMYLRNISKRCRKYMGALGVIAHSLIDFLAEKIRMYGQALLENPTYKLFFGTDGQNLKETASLYNLSEQEQMILQAGIRGEALALIGNQRAKVRFDIPQYKLDCMGKGGGA